MPVRYAVVVFTLAVMSGGGSVSGCQPTMTVPVSTTAPVVASTAPAEHYWGPRQATPEEVRQLEKNGGGMLHEKQPVAISAETAEAIFDDGPTHLRDGWETLIPKHLKEVPGSKTLPRNNELWQAYQQGRREGTALIRANVVRLSQEHLVVQIVGVLPNPFLVGGQYYDNIATLVVPRTPKLDRVLEAPVWEQEWKDRPEQ